MGAVASPSFDSAREMLLAEASARCGLEDFGSDDFREGYGRLLDGLDQAGLSALGTAMARENIIANLIARLKAADGFKRRPEAMTGPIRRPLVITGIPRSGTTALHKLLSMDPQFQGPEHWLCAAPQPRPLRSQWASNADFRQAKAALDQAGAFGARQSKLAMHDVGQIGARQSVSRLCFIIDPRDPEIGHDFLSRPFATRPHVDSLS